MSNVYLEQAARGKNQWWRYLLTVVAMAVAYLFFNIPYTLGLFLAAKGAGEGGVKLDPVAGSVTHLPLPWLALGMVAFAVVLGALALSVRYVHRRPFRSLIGEGVRFDARRFGLAAVTAFALLSVCLAVQLLLDPGAATRNQSPDFWLAVALFAVLLPIQASTEELLIRGWLMQGLSRLTRFQAIPVVVSAMVFAAPHLANPEVQGSNPALAFTFFFAFGALLSVVTLRTGRLELAMGLHTGWNLFGFLIASPANTVVRPVSLWVSTEALSVAEVLMVPIVIAGTYWICTRVQTKRAALAEVPAALPSDPSRSARA